MEITWRIISRGVEEERWGVKVQRIQSISGRYKIDRERLRIVWEMEKWRTQRTYMYDPWT